MNLSIRFINAFFFYNLEKLYIKIHFIKERKENLFISYSKIISKLFKNGKGTPKQPENSLSNTTITPELNFLKFVCSYWLW